MASAVPSGQSPSRAAQMARPTPQAPVAQTLLERALDHGPGAEPLRRQLFQRLRHAIFDGRLVAGSALPGSRALAEGLALSRNTVTAAYEQLVAEGYVVSDRQGTRVAALAQRPAGPSAARHPAPAVPEVPAMAARLALIQPRAPRTGATPLALSPGMPALSQFPLAAWRRALDHAVLGGGPAALGYGDPLGEMALRTAIARHLAVARGVRCAAEQVVITEGAQEALVLCVRLLSNPGDVAWVEDPGYRGAKSALQAGDLRTVPLRVDAQGLVANESDWTLRTPRLVYTSPSHQYPGGAVMSVARRLALIEQARRHGAWIIEDDYDSEFRHAGEPIGAMQGLVDGAPVLYVGTFSKTMFPSLRLGFVVLPAAVLDAVRLPLAEMLRGGQRHAQLAMAHFMDSGQFSRHLGRMRRLYRERQQALRAALARHLAVPHQTEGGHCGMHLLVRLPANCPDHAIAAAARSHGMAPSPLSGFAMQPQPQDNGLVLGYGNTPVELFEPLVQRLSLLAQAAMT
nr:PLP-dependent aminotransferase family protein [Acidovorax sp. Leaf78]